MALIHHNHLQRRPLTAGMIGCSLSHRALYERIARSGLERVLILEDDLEVVAPNVNRLASALGELPADWELLYLDYWQPAMPSPKQRLIQVKHGLESVAGRFPLSVGAIRRRFAASYSTHLLKPGYFYYTSAYAITSSAARTLLKLQSPVSYAPDHLLGKACTENLVNAFAVKHKVFAQYSMKTGESLTR
jgi:glycosyl transferase family 25